MRGRYHKWLENSEKVLKVIRRLKIKNKFTIFGDKILLLKYPYKIYRLNYDYKPKFEVMEYYKSYPIVIRINNKYYDFLKEFIIIDDKYLIYRDISPELSKNERLIIEIFKKELRNSKYDNIIKVRLRNNLKKIEKVYNLKDYTGGQKL